MGQFAKIKSFLIGVKDKPLVPGISWVSGCFGHVIMKYKITLSYQEAHLIRCKDTTIGNFRRCFPVSASLTPTASTT